MIFGYARVSTDDQNLDLQIAPLSASGCEEIITEKISTRVKYRSAWEGLKAKLRKDDTVIVYKIDRIARNVRELFAIVDYLDQQGIHLKSLQESWLDTSTPAGRMIFTVMAGIAEFERDLIKDRTSAGREAAMKRGVKFGRPRKLDDGKAVIIQDAIRNGTPICEIADAFDVSPDTIYRVRNAKCSN